MSAIKKKTGSFSSFDGTKIYYEARGEGRPLVFVYGIACLMNHWHFQVDYFSLHYTVITFDIRGHHNSEQPRDPSLLTIESVAKDIGSLMDHLKIPIADLIGHSFGAPILIEAFRLFPERIRSLSFVNGFARNPIRGLGGVNLIEPAIRYINESYASGPINWDQVWRFATSNPLAGLISGLLGGFNLKVAHFKDIEIYARGVSELPLKTFINLFEDMLNYNGTELLDKIQCPTLIIAGNQDEVTPLRFQEEMHSHIKHSELCVVPYGSHCTQLDFPEFVNLKIEKFLETQKPT